MTGFTTKSALRAYLAGNSTVQIFPALVYYGDYPVLLAAAFVLLSVEEAGAAVVQPGTGGIHAGIAVCLCHLLPEHVRSVASSGDGAAAHLPLQGIFPRKYRAVRPGHADGASGSEIRQALPAAWVDGRRDGFLFCLHLTLFPLSEHVVWQIGAAAGAGLLYRRDAVLSGRHRKTAEIAA